MSRKARQGRFAVGGGRERAPRRFRSPEGELIVFGDGRAIVTGASDAARALGLRALRGSMDVNVR